VVGAGRISNDLAERIRAEFADADHASGAQRDRAAALWRRRREALARGAVKAERSEVIRLWRENQISDEVLHRSRKDLDYQNRASSRRRPRETHRLYALLALAVFPAHAQYPDRPVTLLAVSPGGSSTSSRAWFADG